MSKFNELSWEERHPSNYESKPIHIPEFPEGEAISMTAEELKEELVNKLAPQMIFGKSLAVKRQSAKNFLEQVFFPNLIKFCKENNIVELLDCKFCEGTGLIGGAGINDRCDDCYGSGKDIKSLKSVSEVLGK